jgi:hypothetical protein
MVTTLRQPTKQPATQDRGSSGRPRWIVGVAFFLLCQCAAILFVEGILYCTGLGEEEIFRFDSDIGFVHMTNKRITWRTEGFAQSYLDADGMRQPGLTIARPANTFRVAVLGDSMVEGLQVPLAQTFGEIIAHRLSPFDHKQIQWLNFGTSGYSTVQEYLQMKRQVMKYQPDLIILCYNSRDMFENWSAPDQVVTNVRPFAIKLPGGELSIYNLPVRRWMRSPRGQFMVATTWLREHSRIVGLLSALDLEMSQNNLWYKGIMDLFSHPQKALTDLGQAIASMKNSGPSFQVKFFEDAPQPVKSPPATKVFNSAASNESLSKGSNVASTGIASNGSPATTSGAPVDSVYKQVVIALRAEMKKTANAGGADFAAIGLPVRSQLCPMPGMETSFAGFDYDRELDIVRQVCETDCIPFCNVETAAESLPVPQREKFYYTAHLTPDGQKFVADTTQPFVRKLLAIHVAKSER